MPFELVPDHQPLMHFLHWRFGESGQGSLGESNIAKWTPFADLDGALEHFSIYWEQSSQLTDIFQGSNHQPVMI